MSHVGTRSTGSALRGLPAALPWRGILGFTGFLVLLEVLPRTPLVNELYFPPFSRMMASLGEMAGTAAFWEAVLLTLRGWALGLAIATVLGVLVGVAIGSTQFSRRITASTIEFLRPIPAVAIIPLTVLMFGADLRSSLVLVVYGAFWQVLIQVLYGVGDVDPVAADTARSFRFGRLLRVRTVIWPTALPYVVTGVRLAAAVALILQITAELVIGIPGLGQRLLLAETAGNVPAMFALVIVTGVIGVLVNIGARLLQRRVLAWHPSMRKDLPK